MAQEMQCQQSVPRQFELNFISRNILILYLVIATEKLPNNPGRL